MSDLTDIRSPFNACMFREHCRGEIDRLRVQCKMLMDDKAALQKEIALADSMYKLVVLERDALRQYLDAAQRRAESLREQLTLAETVRAGQVAGLVEGAEKLRERVAVLEDALTHISLCSQSSMSSKEECGRVARAALKGEA